MRFSPQSLLAGIAVLALIVGACLALRADLAIAWQSPESSRVAASIESAEADEFCFRHQGDGCWPQGEEGAGQMTARNERP